MGEIYRVDTTDEALNLARKFKANGTYNLFRGQRKNWKVVPTMARNHETTSEVKDKLIRLFQFFQDNPKLKPYSENIDWFYAVAQHYGLPTSYIDFSTDPDVAAFFATNDSMKNASGEEAAIICLNESDFNETMEMASILFQKDKVLTPYIFRANVSNLWRLQAQKGCFLFTPYSNIEDFHYDFDRILFPFDQPFTGIKRKDIYPHNQSELEILLQQYFNTEERLTGYKRLKQFAKDMDLKIHSTAPLDFTQTLSEITVHKSWSSSTINKWTFSLKEPWKETSTVIRLRLRPQLELSLSKQVDGMVKQLLDLHQKKNIVRKMFLEFYFIGDLSVQRKKNRAIHKVLKLLWEGLRGLPYGITDILRILAKYIVLELNSSNNHKPVSLSGHELIPLEMTNPYGSITRGFASSCKLKEAFREDIDEIVLQKFKGFKGPELLLRVNDPKLVFNFDRLTKLFVEELISYQAIYNSDLKHPIIFFNPIDIDCLGYQ